MASPPPPAPTPPPPEVPLGAAPPGVRALFEAADALEKFSDSLASQPQPQLQPNLQLSALEEASAAIGLALRRPADFAGLDVHDDNGDGDDGDDDDDDDGRGKDFGGADDAVHDAVGFSMLRAVLACAPGWDSRSQTFAAPARDGDGAGRLPRRVLWCKIESTAGSEESDEVSFSGQADRAEVVANEKWDGKKRGGGGWTPGKVGRRGASEEPGPTTTFSPPCESIPERTLDALATRLLDLSARRVPVLSVVELKQKLARRGIDFSHCVERQDLIDLLRGPKKDSCAVDIMEKDRELSSSVPLAVVVEIPGDSLPPTGLVASVSRLWVLLKDEFGPRPSRPLLCCCASRSESLELNSTLLDLFEPACDHLFLHRSSRERPGLDLKEVAVRRIRNLMPHESSYFGSTVVRLRALGNYLIPGSRGLREMQCVAAECILPLEPDPEGEQNAEAAQDTTQHALDLLLLSETARHVSVKERALVLAEVERQLMKARAEPRFPAEVVRVMSLFLGASRPFFLAQPRHVPITSHLEDTGKRSHRSHEATPGTSKLEKRENDEEQQRTKKPAFRPVTSAAPEDSKPHGRRSKKGSVGASRTKERKREKKGRIAKREMRPASERPASPVTGLSPEAAPHPVSVAGGAPRWAFRIFGGEAVGKGTKSYVEYVIYVRDQSDGREWVVRKRYSQFADFHDLLKADYPEVARAVKGNPLRLTGKQVISKQTKKLTQRRTIRLGSYLNAVAGLGEIETRLYWSTFIGLDAGGAVIRPESALESRAEDSRHMSWLPEENVLGSGESTAVGESADPVSLVVDGDPSPQATSLPAGTPVASQKEEEASVFLQKSASALPVFANDRIIRGKKLGQGSFGSVHEVRIRDQPGMHLALKRVQIGQARNKEHLQSLQQALLSEISLLRVLSHKAIVGFVGIVPDPTGAGLLMEIYDGSLDRWVEERNEGLLPWFEPREEIGEWMRQILSGLVYLHQRSITHRDLKPENILFRHEENQLSMHIADLGVSKVAAESEASNHTLVGTDGFLAPEIEMQMQVARLTGQVEDIDPKKGDVYATGMIAFVLLSGVTRVSILKGPKSPYRAPLPAEAAGLGTSAVVEMVSNLPRPLYVVPAEVFERNFDSKTTDARWIYDEVFYSCASALPDARPAANDLLRKLEEFVDPKKKVPGYDGLDAQPN